MSEQGEDKLFERLRAILLDDERHDRMELHDRMEEIRQLLSDYDQMGELIEPHVKEKLDDVRENFNEYFGPQITESLKKQIADSKDAVIEALYPIMGRLIRKFIQSEIAQVVERVDERVSSTFSLQNFKRRIVGIFTGVQESELALKELNAPVIEEVFVIQKQSGLLLGSFSRNNTIDRDMIAGMTTAIKSFAEDAFQRKTDELETIQYESFNILLQSFYSYYMAVVVSGVATRDFKDHLRDQCMAYAERNLDTPVQEVSSILQDRISSTLKDQFNEFK